MTIDSISADEGTYDYYVYDQLDGDSSVGLASVEVDATIGAYAYKSDIALLDDRVSIIHSDWNDHMMQVEFEVALEARLNVTVVGLDVGSVELDALSVVRPSHG
jgi:hypothetical protein